MSTSNEPQIESALIYKYVLQNMQDAVIVISLDGKIIIFNPAAKSLFQIKDNDITGKKFTALFQELLSDPRNDPFIDTIFSAIYESNITHNIDAKYYNNKIHKDLLISSTALFSDDNKSKVGMILVISDITQRQRLIEIQDLFEKYIAPRITNQLLGTMKNNLNDPDKHVFTVSFCDMNNFTQLCQVLPPTTMKKIMNLFFTKMSSLVHKNDGVIDKFIGDSIMSFWGEPFTTMGVHSLCGCQTALDQIESLKALNDEIHNEVDEKYKNITININIGIATGELIVANIGSDEHKSFTIMGNVVNLSARLVNVNKTYGTHILISENVVNSIGDSFEYREIDKIQIRGHETRIKVYELLGRKGSLTQTQAQFIKMYASALSLYRQRQWEPAKQAFMQALHLVPNDVASKVFLERIKYFKKHPPRATWDEIWAPQK